MKAIVRDIDAIGAVSPLNFLGYLRSRGWIRYSEVSGVFTVWHHPNNPTAEVLVPLKSDARDFIARVSDALAELEQVEARSQIDILRDILNSGFDLVRLAAKSFGTNDGTIRVQEGVALYEGALDMLMAAACATVKPQAVFHSRKPNQANEFMQEARFGQTEQGSFVLTILSPVGPQLTPYGSDDLFPEEPFERKVIQTLARAVARTVSAAEKAFSAQTPNFEPFQAAVSEGVSANLCEAIARLFKFNPEAILLTTSWAVNRPPPAITPDKTIINKDVVPAIEQAASIFRARDTLESYVIKGFVVKLERDAPNDGRATVYAPVEEVMRRVVVSLLDADYYRALDAHGRYIPIRVVGDVVKKGRTYQLHAPVQFDLSTDDGES